MSRTDMPSFPRMPKIPNTRIVKSRQSESPLQSPLEKEVPTKPTLAVQSMAVQRRIAHMPRTQLLLNRRKQRDRHSLGRRQSGLHSWTMSCHRQTWTHRSQLQRWYIVWRILLLALPNRLYHLLELRHARATRQRKPKTKAITRFKMNINSNMFYMAPMKALLSFSRSKILTWPIITESYQPKTRMSIKFLASRRKSKKVTKQEGVQRLHNTYQSNNR